MRALKATAHSNVKQLGMRSIVATALAVAVIGISGGSASAAPDQNTTANAVVASGITLTALTPSFTLTGAPGATVTSTPVTYNVETNDAGGYAVTVQAAAATMTPAVANGDSIPIADLTVRETGTTPYAALSNTVRAPVHSQAGRSANGGDALSTEFRMRIPVVAPDTYSATLNYLAAASL